MKKGWQTNTLGEIGKISMCKRIFKEETTATGDIPFYKIGTFGKEPDAFIPNQTYNEYRSKYPFPKKGDVLISASGTIGRRVRYDGEPAYFQDSNIVWIVNDEKQVLNDYLYYFYGACEWNSTKGSTISRLYNDDLRRIAIGFPESLAEQQRIVGLLDDAFEGLATAKANAEKNLQNARALFESHLQSVFTQRGNGWVEKRKPLSDLCDLIVDCEHKTAPTQEHGIPSIRTPNIGKGKLLLDGVNRVSEETYKNWTRRAEPMPKDLILAREAPAGNVAVIPENMKVCLGQRTVLIRPKVSIFDSSFLAFLLLEPKTQAKLLAHSRGATVQHVNMKDIRALDVGAIPPLEVQQSIVSTLGDLEAETQRLARIYERKLAALAELKKSLLHQAFTGEL